MERRAAIRPLLTTSTRRTRKLPRQVDSSKVEFSIVSSRSRYRAGGRLPSASCGRVTLCLLARWERDLLRLQTYAAEPAEPCVETKVVNVG
jgi:hypothetical protein